MSYQDYEARCEAALSCFAVRASQSRGRLGRATRGRLRNEFQRDRDRIIHSRGFRRLAHKTQVMVAPKNDHMRTRLTHSIEAAQLARTLARALGLNEDLTEAIALAHDLGHPPFGHAGEQALDKCLEPWGGFDHNDQTLRLVSKLENPDHPNSYGLNLTLETLEGLLKHNGASENPSIVQSDLAAKAGIDMQAPASLEAQVAALSDDLAYLHHDFEDGLRAKTFVVEDFAKIHPKIARLFQRADGAHNLKRALMDAAINDAYDNALVVLKDKSKEDLPLQVIAHSPEQQEIMDVMRSFLNKHFYQHERIKMATNYGKNMVTRLFARLMESDFSNDKTPRQIGDYIAGMTDRFAKREAEKDA